MSEGGIIVFVRYPEPGKVKTRLARDLGDEAAAELYSAFVKDTLEGLRQAEARRMVFYDPDLPSPEGAEEAVREWLGPDEELFPQRGHDLGQRMEAAFRRAFALGLERVVIMGSDVPDFPGPLVGMAVDVLHRRDAVVGPAQDGGYYLIGFNRKAYMPEIFENMPWGTDQVYARTVKLLLHAGLEMTRLPEWNDVDTVRDLNVLWRLNKNSSFAHSRTYELLATRTSLLKDYDREAPETLDERGLPPGETGEAHVPGDSSDLAGE